MHADTQTNIPYMHKNIPKHHIRWTDGHRAIKIRELKTDVDSKYCS